MEFPNESLLTRQKVSRSQLAGYPQPDRFSISWFNRGRGRLSGLQLVLCYLVEYIFKSAGGPGPFCVLVSLSSVANRQSTPPRVPHSGLGCDSRLHMCPCVGGCWWLCLKTVFTRACKITVWNFVELCGTGLCSLVRSYTVTVTTTPFPSKKMKDSQNISFFVTEHIHTNHFRIRKKNHYRVLSINVPNV